MTDKHLNSSTVIMDTELCYKMFSSCSSAMSNLDYDLDELTCLIFDILDNANGVEERLKCFVDSYLNFGSLSPEPTEDGIILSNALQWLAFSLLDLVRKLGVYSERGILRYTYTELKNFKTVVLTRKPGMDISICTKAEATAGTETEQPFSLANYSDYVLPEPLSQLFKKS